MKSIALFALFMTILLAPVEALACACCAERGQYNISATRPSASEIEILNDIKFNEATELFTGAADFDVVKGLKPIEKDYMNFDFSGDQPFFTLANAFAAKTWKFNFKTKTGKTGTLVLPLPSEMVSFGADIHDTPAGQEVVLYKEWRFKGAVQSGSGFFSAGIVKPTTYFLVLQGRGNNCPAAESFTHWRLEIKGRGADYTFFGKLN